MKVISIHTSVSTSPSRNFGNVQYIITATEGISYHHAYNANDFVKNGKNRIKEALESDGAVKNALGVGLQMLLNNPQDDELLEALYNYVTSFSHIQKSKHRKVQRQEVIRVLNEATK